MSGGSRVFEIRGRHLGPWSRSSIDEPEAERFRGLLLDQEPVISCATLIETLRVISAASFGANAPASWCEEAFEQLCPSAAE
jgi:hypothetical protein